MKVTQQSEPKFIPVVITLETQEEVDILWDLLGRVGGGGVGRKFCSETYDKLHPWHNCAVGKYFDSTLSTKHY